MDTATPIYDSVLLDLEIDPEDHIKIDHEERFSSIVHANASKILDGDDQNYNEVGFDV